MVNVTSGANGKDLEVYKKLGSRMLNKGSESAQIVEKEAVRKEEITMSLELLRQRVS